jgi:hypothetical protein
LESQGIDKALHVMASLNNAQLGQQCALFEQELRKEDAALDSDTSSLAGGTQNRMHPTIATKCGQNEVILLLLRLIIKVH